MQEAGTPERGHPEARVRDWARGRGVTLDSGGRRASVEVGDLRFVAEGESLFDTLSTLAQRIRNRDFSERVRAEMIRDPAAVTSADSALSARKHFVRRLKLREESIARRLEVSEAITRSSAE